MQLHAALPQPRPIANAKARWQTLVVVCRQCCKRSSGPRKLKSKRLARTLHGAMRTEERSRVVLSSCMGLCPKRAIAVARTGTAEGEALWSIASLDEGRALVAQWLRAQAQEQQQGPSTVAPLPPAVPAS